MAENKTADDLATFAGELSRRNLLLGAAMLAGSGLLPEIARAQELPKCSSPGGGPTIGTRRH